MKVSWGYYSLWKNKIHVPNQPDQVFTSKNGGIFIELNRAHRSSKQGFLRRSELDVL